MSVYVYMSLVFVAAGFDAYSVVSNTYIPHFVHCVFID